jgi:amino acid adenylation domain-containing protein
VTSLSRVLFEKTKDYASLDALSVSGRTITYQELKDNALYVASALIQLGANNEAIGIVGQRKASSYFGVVGILFAGCYYTPINPKYSEKRILSILRDAKIRFLVGDKADLEMLEKVISPEGFSSIQAIVLPEGQSPTEKKWLDEKSIKSLTPLDKPKSMDLDDLAYLLYTSGSTGMPKGVQVANSNVLAFLRNMSSIYKLDPGFRASQTFDFSFDPSVSDMFFTWTNGGVLCVLPEEELLLPTEFIQRENITFWNSVPSIAGFMIKMGHLVPGCFPTLTNSMFCGEQFAKYIADAWQKAAPNSTVENLYGPTEATIYISRYLYSLKDKEKQFKNSIIPIGRSFEGHSFALIDESGNRLEDSRIGEIVYKGPQVTKGYLNDSVKTDSVFVTFSWDSEGGRWYKSGDLGFFNEFNDLECIGRKDSQIKLGGRRIEIGEIEAVLSGFPLIQDIVVVPLKDDNQIVVGCVAFTMNKVDNLELETIRKQSEKLLERIFFPKKIITIEAFPLAQSGKIDRKALALLAAEMMSSRNKQ